MGSLTKNSFKITTTGVEVAINYARKIAAGHSLSGSLERTWLQSNGKDSVKSFCVSSHAKLLTNFSVKWSALLFSFSCSGIYRKPQTASATNTNLMSDYFVLNSKVEASMRRKKLRASIEADVFTRKHQDVTGAESLVRWFMGGMKIFFTSQHPLHE